MNSDAATKIDPSPKPLASLGRDEMNLAEFPISLLTDRVPKDQSEAIYQDEIYDGKSGLTLSRKLTITAGNRGLTTAADDEVILCLIQLTWEKSNFNDRRVDFTRHELVQRLGWSVGGQSYDRVAESLERWTSVFLKYENAWRDNRSKTWKTVGFHIIDKYELHDTRSGGDQMELLPSFIIWGQDIFESFKAGYLRELDYDLCMSLRNATAKRMYRFLDKRFYHGHDLTFELKEFAHEHIGMGRHYEGPAHLIRTLHPAIQELEKISFLEKLEKADRFQKVGSEWKIRLVKMVDSPAVAATTTQIGEVPEIPPLTGELVARGVSKVTAADLVRRCPAESIEHKIEVFDWLVNKDDKKVAKNPAGYLFKSITDDYADPKGFTSRAKAAALAEKKRQAEQQEQATRREQQRREAAERAKDRRDASYWESLSPSQKAELQAMLDAKVDPNQLALETGPLKSMGQHLRRHAYIRQLLDSREPATAG